MEGRFAGPLIRFSPAHAGRYRTPVHVAKAKDDGKKECMQALAGLYKYEYYYYVHRKHAVQARIEMMPRGAPETPAQDTRSGHGSTCNSASVQVHQYHGTCVVGPIGRRRANWTAVALPLPLLMWGSGRPLRFPGGGAAAAAGAAPTQRAPRLAQVVVGTFFIVGPGLRMPSYVPR